MSDCFCTKTYQCLACERVEAKKAGKKVQRKIAQCGTRAGYNRHIRLREATCAECKAAQADGVNKWNRSKRLDVA